MPSMLSYPRRLQSGHFTCYLYGTYHVLTTKIDFPLDSGYPSALSCAVLGDSMNPLRNRLRSLENATRSRRHEGCGRSSMQNRREGAMISTLELATVKKITSAAALLLVLILLASTSFAQQLTGTLSATVTDSAGAVVPNAKVTMKNEKSGDVRTTVSNGSGYFTVTAVQPGSYSVTVEAPGFKTWQQTGIVFAQGDSRTLPNVKLEVGQVTVTVEIKAGIDVVIPDTSEVSTTLNTDLVESVPTVGRDAGELLKLMPGMAINNGGSQGSAFKIGR